MITLLSLKNVSYSYSNKINQQNAVDQVSLDILDSESIGIVGESGSGKSTLALLSIGLLTNINLCPKNISSIQYRDIELSKLSAVQKKQFQQEIQIIFQDSLEALNPRHIVREILNEPLIINCKKPYSDKELTTQLNLVGLSEDFLYRYPHEMSGGERQRINFARALILRPKLLIMDEPFSALDVTTMISLIKLLKGLKDSLGLNYCIISHDLNAVSILCNKIYVMQNGKIIDTYETKDKIKTNL